jgi:hypothetical protein
MKDGIVLKEYLAELGIRYFYPIRYSLFRYFNTSFRYRYSATFPTIAIRYSLFAIATFVSSVLRTASILGLYLR